MSLADELNALAARATPAPWVADPRTVDNANLVRALRNALPTIIPALEAMEPRKGERRTNELLMMVDTFKRWGPDRRKVGGTKENRGAAATSQHPTKTDGAAASAQSAPLPDRIEALLSVSPVKLDISGALGWQVNAANLLREAAKELRK